VRPLVFSWPYALIFWVVYVWAFLPETALIRRAERTVKENKEKDSGSLHLILMGLWVALAVAFPLAFLKSTQFPTPAALPAFWAGVGMLVAGSLLRRHCWRTLGEFFTGDVQTRADQPVIDRGAYKWVRHPSYTGGMLMFSGIGVALANWVSLSILTIVSIFVYSYRVLVEERALVAALGDSYLAFRKTRKRFIPFIV
jgi:protein-S-isoprenylcysteine O-methyltransferase Ste14